jgi:hypothetical protein
MLGGCQVQGKKEEGAPWGALLTVVLIVVVSILAGTVAAALLIGLFLHLFPLS